MHLSAAGHAALYYWQQIPQYHPHACLDAFVVMPNHMHGILVLRNVGAQYLVPSERVQSIEPLRQENRFQGMASGSLGSIIRGFKVGVTKWCRQHTHIDELWQRSFYEHIFRDERSWENLRHYIATNPRRWAEDRFFAASDC